MAKIDSTHNEQAQGGLSRRDFMGLSWRIAGALVLGESAYLGLRFLSSRKAEGVFGRIVTAGVVNDFPPGTITPFDQERFFLVRFEDGGFLALSTKCTHLACVVAWNEGEGRFSCPCHGSEFERNGTVINPPAPRPLDRFAVTIEDDRVQVDTGKPIQRNRADPDDLVHAPEEPDEPTPGTTPESTPEPGDPAA
jgi:cytochrome b6-f complex iron-sulfur subunit